MRVLVTGGAGFIGRALQTRLVEDGHEVAITSRDARAVAAPKVRVFGYRIGVDHPGDVLTALGARPEAVIHLAGPSNVWETEAAGDEAGALITEGTRAWVDALQALDGPPIRLIVGGSCHEYGDTIAERGPRMSEAMPLLPNSVYARAKVAAEELALARNGDGVDVIAARAFNQVGIGQKPAFFVPSLVRRIVRAKRAGDERIEAGDLSVVRDLVDVRDGARAYALLATKGVPGRVYNIGTGGGLRLREAVQQMLRTLNADHIRVDEVPNLGAGGRDLLDHYADIGRITADTGYEPIYAFADTVASVRDEHAASDGQGG